MALYIDMMKDCNSLHDSNIEELLQMQIKCDVFF